MTPNPQTETLEDVAEQITNIPFNNPWTANQLKSAILSALHNERERALRIIDERVQQCEAHVALNDQQDREHGYGCWRDIANALRHAAAAIREGK